ncbi:MAG TPA: DUF983 domain-containing protein [Candidatus Kapabacteria bacterium]|nr:DUF983 domain-containing protein [Candidatus Kapabacteria bacterium]
MMMHEHSRTPAIEPAHGKLWATLHMRCPRCHHGRVYTGLWTMLKVCSVCHLVYQREPGYFTGATFFSYALGTTLVGIWIIIFFTFFPELPDIWVHGLALALMLPFLPIIMRYSRILWMMMDRSIDISPQ